MPQHAKTIAVVMLHPLCDMHCPFCITENSMNTMSFEQASDLI